MKIDERKEDRLGREKVEKKSWLDDEQKDGWNDVSKARSVGRSMGRSKGRWAGLWGGAKVVLMMETGTK